MSKSKAFEMAKRLGFSLARFEKITGYCRQSLYGLFEGKHRPSNRRMHAAVKAIKLAIEEEYQRDVQELEARYAVRREAAEELLEIAEEGIL